MIEAIKLQMCIDDSSLPEFLATALCMVPFHVWFGALVAIIVIVFLMLALVGSIMQAVEKKRRDESPLDRWKRGGWK